MGDAPLMFGHTSSLPKKEKISCFPNGICVSSAFDATRGDKHLEVTSNVLNEDEKNGDPRSY